MLNRRLFLSGCLCLPWWAKGASASQFSASRTIHIGLTPVFLDDQTTFLRDWKSFLETYLQQPVAFVQRSRYDDIIRLLGTNQLDFAWVCGFPYWRNRQWLRLVAAPLYRGQPLYQSYLIRHASRSELDSLVSLQGKVFAFSDPDSNSGFLYPRYRLETMGKHYTRFFARTFFTGSHRNVIEAVAVRLADAGAVDGYIWDVLAQQDPGVNEQTVILERSPWFGFPPVVASSGVDTPLLQAFRELLTTMHTDNEGRNLLQTLHLDGFVQVEPELYADIGAMAGDS